MLFLTRLTQLVRQSGSAQVLCSPTSSRTSLTNPPRSSLSSLDSRIERASSLSFPLSHSTSLIQRRFLQHSPLQNPNPDQLRIPTWKKIGLLFALGGSFWAGYYFGTHRESVSSVIQNLGSSTILHTLPPPEKKKNNIEKEINCYRKPDSLFVGRERELREIDQQFFPNAGGWKGFVNVFFHSQGSASQETKVCYLRGPGGTGKSQIALKYAEINQEKYSRIIFVDCENVETLKFSLERIVKAYDQKPSQNLKQQVLSLLENESNYLMMIDNVDTSEIAKVVDGIFPTHSKGHVLIIGRYLRNSLKGGILMIKPLDFENGVKLFEASLQNRAARELFRSETEEDKREFLLNELGGSPLAIRIAAQYFRRINMFQAHPLRIKDYSKILHEHIEFFADNSLFQEEIGYGTTLLKACLPTIDRLQHHLFGETEKVKSLVINIMRFFAFFGLMQYIPVDIDEMFLLFQTLYSEVSLSKSMFNEILYQLKNNSLIDVQVNTENTVNSQDVGTSNDEATSIGSETRRLLIFIPQPVRWAIQIDYLRHCQALENSEEVEWARSLWFRRVNQYLNHVTTIDTIDETSMMIFFSLVHFLNEQQYSESIEVEFLSHSNILDILFELTTSNPERAKGLLNSFSSESLNAVIDKVLNIIDKTQDEKKRCALAELMMNVGLLYSESDPEKAEGLINIAINAGHQQGYFHLHSLYNIFYLSEIDDSKKRARLIKQLEFCEKQISIEPSPLAYSNRAECFLKLNHYQEAITDWKKAIDLDAYNPLFYSNLSSAYLSISQPDEGEKYKRIAEGLRNAPPTFSALPDSDKQAILAYLGSKTHFDFMHSAPENTLKSDLLTLFIEVLNLNPTIEVLNLHRCIISEEVFLALIRSIQSNRCIRELDFEWNPSLSNTSILTLFETAPEQLKKIHIKGFIPLRKQLGEELVKLGLKYQHSSSIIAKRCFKTAINLDNECGYVYLGNLYRDLSDSEANSTKREKLLRNALKCYDKTISINPSADNYARRGFAYNLLKRYGEAAIDYKMAAKLDPFNPLFYEDIGHALSHLPDSKLESQKFLVIATVLKKDLVNFSILPPLYKETILEFLSSDTEFEVKNFTSESTSPIDFDHGVAFCKMLWFNPGLTSLRIDGSHINDKGLAIIAERLKDPESSIKELKIESNDLLTDVGLYVLADSLRKNTKVKVLSFIGCNRISYQGILALILGAEEGMTISLNWFGSKEQAELTHIAQLHGIHLEFAPWSLF